MSIAQERSRDSRHLLAAPFFLFLSLSPYLRKSISICVANWKGIVRIDLHIYSPANVKRQLISLPSVLGASIAAVRVTTAYRRDVMLPTIVSTISPVLTILRYFYCRTCLLYEQKSIIKCLWDIIRNLGVADVERCCIHICHVFVEFASYCRHA